jgi:hypothetical protein
MTKVKRLKKAENILVGMPVPQQNYGNVGRFVEDILENAGYPINRGNGCDIKELAVEVKTRTIEATSAHTVASQLPKNIVKTPYKDSAVFKKFQQQFRVYHSEESGQIESADMYDFTVDEIQSRIEHAYESARKVFATGIYGNYVKGSSDAWGYFEKTVATSNSYDFRIPNHIMKKIESISKGQDLFKALFDF